MVSLQTEGKGVAINPEGLGVSHAAAQSPSGDKGADLAIRLSRLFVPDFNVSVAQNRGTENGV